MNVLLLEPVFVDVRSDEDRQHVHGQIRKHVKHTAAPPSVVRLMQ